LVAQTPTLDAKDFGMSIGKQQQKTETMCNYKDLINDVITKEQVGYLMYMELSYKFKTTTLNRPNFASFLSSKAKQSRERADALATFQTERGVGVEFTTIERNGTISEVNDILAALKAVIGFEEVLTTGYYLDLLSKAENGCGANFNTCVKSNDVRDDILVSGKDCKAPHIADLLNSKILVENYKNIHALKKIKGMIEPMVKTPTTSSQHAFYELFFDKNYF